MKMKRCRDWSKLGCPTAAALEAKEEPPVIKRCKEQGRAEGVGEVRPEILFHQSDLDACWDKVYLGLREKVH